VSAAEPHLLGLKAMLNFDMVVTTQTWCWWYALVDDVADRLVSSSSPALYGSDHAPFRWVYRYFFHRGQEPNYHTPKDKQVNLRLLDETAQIGLMSSLIADVRHQFVRIEVPAN